MSQPTQATLEQRVANLEFQVRQYQSALKHLEDGLNELANRISIAQQPRDVRYVRERVRQH